MDCRKDSKRLKSRAHHILETSKPGIRLSAKRIIIALIIKRKRPRVNMVIGKVNMTNIGFTIKLRRLNTMATIMAVV